ncbi:MAG: CapA family protein [Candidatus Portnoybacteria bacterium]|nr:CapA family protein [Candidatus Portnoybacteria bacterium]
MPRKITWLIVLFFSVFTVVFLGSNQPSGEKDFSDFSDQKKKLPLVSEEVSLVAVGDISYSRGVEQIVKRREDINYPFLKIRDFLQSANLVLGNLETPITQGREITDFEMIFRSNPGTEQALKQAGFSVLSLANNHTPNFGEEGLKDTFNYLAGAGIKYVGAGNNEQEAYGPVYVEEKGIRFAFFAYNDADVAPDSYEAGENRAGTAFMRREKMVAAVKEANESADFVIVSMHAGIEYADKPNESQISFARAAIDAGADLVIGHHPHVVQTMEKYRGKYIFYSLGNFVFDQSQSQETKEGLAIRVCFTKNGVSKIDLLPVVMANFAQPEVAGESDKEQILKRLDFPLANRAVYSWDNDAFKKGSEVAVYTEDYSVGGIVSKEETADLDNDSTSEIYSLKNGLLTIMENSKIVWQSPDDWWIDDFILADSNSDGISDINLSLWKAGDFGSSKPFWVKENDMDVKNHFFIFDFIDDAMKQIWGSSNLGKPNCEFQIADIDNDGKNDLIVIEGDYSQKPKCNGNYVAVWKWNDWGFSNEWRSEKGVFSNLEIEKNDGKSYIVVDFF